MKVTAPNRKVYLSSTAGVSVSLKPGETRSIPALLREDALNAGCTIAEEPNSILLPVEVNPQDRIDQIVEAIRTIADRGDKTDFTMSGKPRLSSVRMATGLDVTIAELNSAMESME